MSGEVYGPEAEHQDYSDACPGIRSDTTLIISAYARHTLIALSGSRLPLTMVFPSGLTAMAITGF